MHRVAPQLKAPATNPNQQLKAVPSAQKPDSCCDGSPQRASGVDERVQTDSPLISRHWSAAPQSTRLTTRSQLQVFKRPPSQNGRDEQRASGVSSTAQIAPHDGDTAQ